MKKTESISYILWIAAGLFVISEAIHKAFVFSDLLVMPAHAFAVISRVLIYAWFSWKLARYGLSFRQFFPVVILMTIFEFLVLGALSVIALGMLESMDLIIPALMGMALSYPLVLGAVLLQCLLVFGIFRWWIVRSKTKAGTQA